MKQFLIKYRLKNGSEERWHQDIVRFISALDNDPALRGKISYRCMKSRGGSDYYHLATAAAVSDGSLDKLNRLHGRVQVVHPAPIDVPHVALIACSAPVVLSPLRPAI